jgi:hypothetical protein
VKQLEGAPLSGITSKHETWLEEDCQEQTLAYSKHFKIKKFYNIG